ncbi:MAG: hypothetical protein V3U72_04640 [Candidatus Aenigmarchaeota archaeon]
MKAQVWSLDLITSLVVFLVVLIPLFFVWSYVNMQSQQQILFDEIEMLSLSVSDSLIRTEGLPEGWNSSSVTLIGLASEENILNATKVSYFLTMGNSEYNRTRAILTGSYDFFFNLTDLNGTSHGTIGNKPQNRMIIPIERYCLYNERIVKLEFALIV